MMYIKAIIDSETIKNVNWGNSVCAKIEEVINSQECDILVVKIPKTDKGLPDLMIGHIEGLLHAKFGKK